MSFRFYVVNIESIELPTGQARPCQGAFLLGMKLGNVDLAVGKHLEVVCIQKGRRRAMAEKQVTPG